RYADSFEGRLAGLQIAVKESGQLGLRERADLLGVGLAALVQDDGGNAPDAVLAGRGRIGVDVELRHGQLALVGLGDLVQHRREHLARTAPFGPEVDQNRVAGLQDVLLERGIGDLFDRVTHLNPLVGRPRAARGGATARALSLPYGNVRRDLLK